MLYRYYYSLWIVREVTYTLPTFLKVSRVFCEVYRALLHVEKPGEIYLLPDSIGR